jgi:hypothetical protein
MTTEVFENSAICAELCVQVVQLPKEVGCQKQRGRDPPDYISRTVNRNRAIALVGCSWAKRARQNQAPGNHRSLLSRRTRARKGEVSHWSHSFTIFSRKRESCKPQLSRCPFGIGSQNQGPLAKESFSCPRENNGWAMDAQNLG